MLYNIELSHQHKTCVCCRIYHWYLGDLKDLNTGKSHSQTTPVVHNLEMEKNMYNIISLILVFKIKSVYDCDNNKAVKYQFTRQLLTILFRKAFMIVT